MKQLKIFLLLQVMIFNTDLYAMESNLPSKKELQKEIKNLLSKTLNTHKNIRVALIEAKYIKDMLTKYPDNNEKLLRMFNNMPIYPGYAKNKIKVFDCNEKIQKLYNEGMINSNTISKIVDYKIKNFSSILTEKLPDLIDNNDKKPKTILLNEIFLNIIEFLNNKQHYVLSDSICKTINSSFRYSINMPKKVSYIIQNIINNSITNSEISNETIVEVKDNILDDNDSNYISYNVTDDYFLADELKEDMKEYQMQYNNNTTILFVEEICFDNFYTYTG